jgi:hypothetical protein
MTMHSFRQQHSLYQRKAKFRFKNKLLSLDSTTISLCLDLFPWAKIRKQFSNGYTTAKEFNPNQLPQPQLLEVDFCL